MQQQILKECFLAISKRPEHACNFLEGTESVAALNSRLNADNHGRLLGPDTKLIYRHNATLYLVFGVDGSESELAILDLIQVFVEVLDKCFENVCELDIIFNFHKAYYILDELFIGGELQETNKREVMRVVVAHEALSRQEAELSSGLFD